MPSQEDAKVTKGGLTDPERWFGQNLKRLREQGDLSQTALAKEMTETGFPFSQTTVKRIEAGERAVRLGEAHALARILATTIAALTQQPEHAVIHAAIQRALEACDYRFRGISQAVFEYLANRHGLERWIEIAKKKPFPDTNLLESAEAAVKIGPEQAIQAGIETFQQWLRQEGADGEHQETT